jgi:hypothetical protein
LNAGHYLGDENKIYDEWGCKKGVFANIEHPTLLAMEEGAM